MPFFECFHDRGRTDVQHPRGIANAAGIHGHIHDLLLDVRRLPYVGVLEEKCTPTIRARPAPIPLLALPCRAMSHNIRTLTVGTVEDLDYHDAPLSRWGFSVSATFDKSSRSTPLEHLPVFFGLGVTREE